MFDKLKRMWSESQERINANALNQCALLVIEVANEILARIPENVKDEEVLRALNAHDGSTLYLLGSATRLRAELRTLQSHSEVALADLMGVFRTPEGWKGDLSSIQRSAVEVVFRHLARDPDIR